MAQYNTKWIPPPALSLARNRYELPINQRDTTAITPILVFGSFFPNNFHLQQNYQLICQKNTIIMFTTSF